MRTAVRFLLGDEPREVANLPPTMTVLEYLRTEARRTGTKEGCAEGDCGACTVVLGRPDANGGMTYRAVNACILFLPTLDGCQLITVEHLRDGEGRLHPAQQAMVDHHGSQCGFCTPGFVMSLFALFHNERNPSRRRIEDVLAGNLCRCTGYRPIIDAAVAMYAYGDADRFDARAADTARRLAALRREGTLGLEHAGQRYLAPVTVEGLVEAIGEHPKATLLAGGTDVGLWVTKRHQDLNTVIHVGDIPELHEIVETDEGLDIGAAATHSEAFDAIARRYPDFGELLRRFASVQIRNSGTLGGNIANGSPIGDSMPVLIALGASVVLRGREGRRTLPIEDYFIAYGQTALAPGEFLERVRIPALADGVLFRCYKISKRFDQDISAICAAFRVDLAGGRVAGARIGLGGVAAIPSRAVATERALVDRFWNEDTVAEAEAVLAGEFDPITDMRASDRYRRTVMTRLLRKFFIETTQPGVATRVLAEEVVS